MQLGFGLVTCQRNPADPTQRSDADLYAQAVELARLCESAGLGSYWVSEHHFVDDGYMPATLATLAAVAPRTQRDAPGAGVVLAPLWHSLRGAEGAATRDPPSRRRPLPRPRAGWR